MMDRPTRRPLKIGVILPTLEGRCSGHPADFTRRWLDLLALAKRAEALGIDSLWLSDHLLFRWSDQQGRAQGVWECWSVLAALAAATERLGLGTLVVCTAFRNPALLAKMADTVDEISGGRLLLGLGAGWHEPEFHAFGFPSDHRVSRFAEAVTIISTLLREGRIDFAGTYYTARECELSPRGPRSQGVPIMIGAGVPPGPRMLRLVAEHADLWNAYLVWGRSWPDAIPTLREQVDAACEAVGRDPATLRRTVALLVNLPVAGTGPVRPEEEPLVGSPDVLAAAFRDFARAGIEHVQLLLNPNTVAGLEALAPTLELLDQG
jgi:alkanesulfonate monooxygenase SsuD/methylene tetrahydromethanopterin reductase-like flavin-dependent oxidoreductase (luciferase family)